MTIARTRVSCSPTPTVYQDTVNGNDAWDGTCDYAHRSGSAGPVQTFQRAFDYASANFDLSPPFTWVECGNVGYRAAVTIQMAPCSSANAETYGFTTPVFLDGAGSCGPILLRGDPTSRESMLNYNVYAKNTLQGFTSQRGGMLLCDGFTIRGDGNCTLINGLEGGAITMKNVIMGQGSTGSLGGYGAAGGSVVTLTGCLRLIGSGFIAVATAIESGRLILAPGCSIVADNNMNFGIMVSLMHAECWTQGSPPTFSGFGGSTGQKYVAYYGAFLGFDHTLIPGSAGASDSTSIVL